MQKVVRGKKNNKKKTDKTLVNRTTKSIEIMSECVLNYRLIILKTCVKWMIFLRQIIIFKNAFKK